MASAIVDSVDTRLGIDTVFGLVMSVWVPSLFVLLACVRSLTVHGL